MAKSAHAVQTTESQTNETNHETSTHASDEHMVLETHTVDDTGKVVTDQRGNVATKPNRIFQDNIDMKALYDEHKTHSNVIRYLASKGYSRSEISQATGKIYQHVRNVLVQDAQKRQAAAQAAQNQPEQK